MKRLLYLMVILLFCSGTALCGPFLVCGPVDADSVTHYLVKVDGGSATIVPTFGNPDGTVMIHYDLGTFSNGVHHLEIAAVNVWGRSEYVPFDFNKVVPNIPRDFELSED